MTWDIPANRRHVAELSLQFWLGCYRLGLKAKCICSHNDKSCSRYVTIKDGIKVRFSDHYHNDAERGGWDQQIVIRSDAEYRRAKQEVASLLERLESALTEAAA